jgi:hypothetical protein
MAVLGRDCGRLGGDDNSVVRELRAASATGVSHVGQVAHADARHPLCFPAITHSVSNADTSGHVVTHADAHSHAGADPSTGSGRRVDRRRRVQREFHHYL